MKTPASEFPGHGRNDRQRALRLAAPNLSLRSFAKTEDCYLLRWPDPVRLAVTSLDCVYNTASGTIPFGNSAKKSRRTLVRDYHLGCARQAKTGLGAGSSYCCARGKKRKNKIKSIAHLHLHRAACIVWRSGANCRGAVGTRVRASNTTGGGNDFRLIESHWSMILHVVIYAI